MAAALDLTPTQASELFDKLDTQGKGYILRKEDVPGFFSTIPGRIIILCEEEEEEELVLLLGVVLAHVTLSSSVVFMATLTLCFFLFEFNHLLS